LNLLAVRNLINGDGLKLPIAAAGVAATGQNRGSYEQDEDEGP
jgi:hypothetical protein